jgi:hypothetical protein
MLKSRDQFERKHTQHNMIEQTKSRVCLAEKAKSSCPDMVHTCPDGMLSDKRSTEPSTSGRFTLEAEKHREICSNFFFPNVSFRIRMYK